MKSLIKLLVTIIVMLVFAIMAIASGESNNSSGYKQTDEANVSNNSESSVKGEVKIVWWNYIGGEYEFNYQIRNNGYVDTEYRVIIDIQESNNGNEFRNIIHVGSYKDNLVWTHNDIREANQKLPNFTEKPGRDYRVFVKLTDADGNVLSTDSHPILKSTTEHENPLIG